MKKTDLLQDVPRDAEISIDEWTAIWKAYNPRHMHIWQWEYLKFMFFLLDKSGDKFIDAEEYRDVMKIYGMSAKDAEKAFKLFAMVWMTFVERSPQLIFDHK